MSFQIKDNQILSSMRVGTGIMLAQTPFVNAFNRLSVVCCHRNASMLQAYRDIYYGVVDGAASPSFWHFQKGISGHLLKETTRISFKPVGLFWLKPQLDHHFRPQESYMGAFKANAIFSMTLASFEMLINPVDTYRTVWQAGQTVGRSSSKRQLLRRLYAGSLGNGSRQFFTWFGYSYAMQKSIHFMKTKTRIDPHSTSGIFVRSYPESFCLTLPVYIFERLKNELQYRPRLIEEATAKKSYRYVLAFKHVLQTQGVKGFARGFFAKVKSNSILVMGANVLVEMGRRAISREETS